MLSTDLAPASAGARVEVRRPRLIVTRRGPSDGLYRAIGYLDKLTGERGDTTYEFRYLAAAVCDAGFVPVVGFADVHRRYRSARLFPSFADRVMSAKRPDRPVYLAAVDLDADADAWEILSATGGYREGDPIELITMPTWDPESLAVSAHFLAHGVRHRGAAASAYISALTPGRTVELVAEPTNEVSASAIRIVGGSTHLGYVPDPLVDFVHAVMRCGTVEVTVVRANSADTHPHLRLLLRLSGRSERFGFDGPEWSPVG